MYISTFSKASQPQQSEDKAPVDDAESNEIGKS